MALEDRDYMKGVGLAPSPGLRGILKNALYWLLATNLLVFLLQSAGFFLIHGMRPQGGLTLEGVRSGSEWWSLISYQFVHADQLHLLFNLFFLWLAGRFLVRDLGNLRFVLLCLWAGVGAGFFHLLTKEIPLSGVDGAVGGYLVGASGTATGLIAGLALTRPNEDLLKPVQRLLPVRLSAKYLGLGMVVMTGAMLFLDRFRVQRGLGEWMPISHHVHLGGMAAGALFIWLFVRKRRELRPETFRPGSRSAPSMRMAEGEESTFDPAPSQIDLLLDKINEHGIESLSPAEKSILEGQRDST